MLVPGPLGAEVVWLRRPGLQGLPPPGAGPLEVLDVGVDNAAQDVHHQACHNMPCSGDWWSHYEHVTRVRIRMTWHVSTFVSVLQPLKDLIKLNSAQLESRLQREFFISIPSVEIRHKFLHILISIFQPLMEKWCLTFNFQYKVETLI